LPSKGFECPVCGYVLRKWAIQCPKCRTDLTDDVDDELQRLAAKYIKKAVK